jgi:hypothetical protein
MAFGKCKLCLSDSDLQWSHYLPRALYRLSHASGELPVLASSLLVVQDQKQVADFVLCLDCERRFDRLGERYAMKMVSRNDGFEMLNLVRKSYRSQVAGDYSIYSASAARIDAAALAYFALSVLWRGGVHVWNVLYGFKTGGLPLGSQEEPIRRYLLGDSPFPRGVAVKLSVACDSMSQDACIFPHPNLDQSYVFTFMTRGILFDVMVADDMPDFAYECCCMHSPDQPIFVGDFQRFLEWDAREFMRAAHIGKSLRSRRDLRLASSAGS